jgi:hypothetical protein
MRTKKKSLFSPSFDFSNKNIKIAIESSQGIGCP